MEWVKNKLNTIFEKEKLSCSTSDTEIDNNIKCNQEEPKKKSINDFKIIRVLGKGSFGKVVNARNIYDDKNYAIKIIDKNFIERKKKVEEVHIERQLLSQFDHPNIIKLYSTFQNKNKLYFVLELAEKGDLKEFMNTQSKYLLSIDIIPYNLAKFFISEIVNGLEYIHSKGIVHRDIKPENIILCEKYHLKIVNTM